MSSRSLLDYVDAPVLVGDPDGRVVHLNPSFESRFQITLEQARGKELATLFEGGAREAVLRAVADVCGGAGPVRFQLRAGDCGYRAVASPISAEDDRVGVVVLLTTELSSDRRMIECARDIQEPLEELTRCLAEFADQVGGRRAERYRLMLEDVAGAIELLRKRADELQSLLSGTSAINP
ncbi:MAG: PAS domain-containing protein [Deltaproteobacteria bacterium]|jgi:PAS domain-containing protein|nr:PAS domain-containing protein [Deltaproteobacteria bacterium]